MWEFCSEGLNRSRLRPAHITHQSKDHAREVLPQNAIAPLALARVARLPINHQGTFTGYFSSVPMIRNSVTVTQVRVLETGPYRQPLSSRRGLPSGNTVTVTQITGAGAEGLLELLFGTPQRRPGHRMTQSAKKQVERVLSRQESQYRPLSPTHMSQNFP